MDNNIKSSEGKTKNITLGLVVSWILGIILGGAGIVSLFSQPIVGIVLLIGAIILLPPANTRWKSILNNGNLAGPTTICS